MRKKLARVFDRPEFRHVLPSFWTVAHKYEMVPEESGSSLKSIAVRDPHLATTYIPFQDPNLLLSFTRLVSRGRPSEESILNWVHEYGLFRRAEKGEAQDGEDEDRESIDEVDQVPVSLETFVLEALQARSALHLYADLSGGGIDALRERIATLRSKYERMEPLSALDTYFVEEWGGEADNVGKADYRLFQLCATVELESLVTGKVKDVRPALWSDYALSPTSGRYRPMRSWECPDLISAMYLQLFLWMTEGLPMSRCAIPTCRTPFPATRRDKQVCSDSCRSNLRHYPHLQRSRRRKRPQTDTNPDTNPGDT